ncbi:MAG: EamA family transporter [Betaproteobacteria bacterium]|jgi:drug/metabolite transporter (DMT)-like permease|nr:EamA family transporter [Burkholderiaceae bacterium]
MPNAARPPSPSSAPGAPLIAACLAATWLIWGSTYLAIKWALPSFPPFLQMGTRFLAAGGLLMAWVLLRGARLPTRAEWISAAVLGALMLGGGFGATAVAQTTVSSGLVVAFIAVVPALVALAEWPYGVRPSRREAAGIALGLVGVVLLSRGAGFAASLPGLLWLTLACVTWSVGSVWARHGLPRALGGGTLAMAPGAAGYASQMLAGGALLALAALAAGERPAWPPEGRALLSWGYLVVAGSLVAFSAYMVLLQRTSTALASSYTFVNPVIGLVLGVTLGGEVVTTGEWLAATVVCAGVLLLLRPRRR